MKEKKIEANLEKMVEESNKAQPFEFEIDKKIDGSLFLRIDGKAEFYPRKSRDGKGGMTTTNKTDNFTVQESDKKVKITITFEKDSLTFNKVMKQATRLVQTLQNMKIV